MTALTRLVLAAILAVASSLSFPASALQLEGARDCVRAQTEAKAPPSECVNRLHADCLQYPQGSEAGLACFIEAKEKWGALIKERMGEIQSAAPEEIGMIAGIEVKYDLQINLLQCDRIQELTLVHRDPDATTAHARARCEATAIGLAYVKLLLQSNSIQ